MLSHTGVLGLSSRRGETGDAIEEEVIGTLSSSRQEGMGSREQAERLLLHRNKSNLSGVTGRQAEWMSVWLDGVAELSGSSL